MGCSVVAVHPAYRHLQRSALAPSSRYVCTAGTGYAESLRSSRRFDCFRMMRSNQNQACPIGDTSSDGRSLNLMHGTRNGSLCAGAAHVVGSLDDRSNRGSRMHVAVHLKGSTSFVPNRLSSPLLAAGLFYADLIAISSQTDVKDYMTFK